MLEKLKSNIKSNLKLKTLIYALIVAALILIDLLTKHFEEKDAWDFNVIPKFIEVHSGVRNSGCAFSFLSEAAWGQTFLIVTTFIFSIVILGVFFIIPEKYVVFKVAICLIFGGAIGNLVDRIAFREVRDFIDVNMFGTMASCNFADFWIVFGTVLATVDVLFLNDSAVLPLTKRARAAQAKRKEEESKAKEESATERKDDDNGE